MSPCSETSLEHKGTFHLSLRAGCNGLRAETQRDFKEELHESFYEARTVEASGICRIITILCKSLTFCHLVDIEIGAFDIGKADNKMSPQNVIS